MIYGRLASLALPVVANNEYTGIVDDIAPTIAARPPSNGLALEFEFALWQGREMAPQISPRD